MTDVTGTNGSDEGSFTEVSKLLLDEPPLQIQPRLACAVGLNEAIVLQQIHYWLVKNAAKHRNVVNGHVWTYNSYRAWRDEAFPWWSVDTVKRAVQRLEAEGLLISMQPRQSDRSKWYRIDYERLAGIFHRSSVQSAPVSGRSAESRAPSVQSAPAHEGNLHPSTGAICPDAEQRITTETSARDSVFTNGRAASLKNADADTRGDEEPTSAKAKNRGEGTNQHPPVTVDRSGTRFPMVR